MNNHMTHFAVSFSLVTVPLGFWIGKKIEVFEGRYRYIASPATLILCLALATLIRLV